MKSSVKWIIVSIIVLPLIVALGLAVVFWAGGENLPSLTRKIALIRVNDIIYDVQETVDQLKQCRTDRSIAGVVLRINSPGGAVAPSQELYREVLQYSQIEKPLVVSMDNIAASGGYYVASAARTIFANPGTLTGSIGVIMRLSHYEKLLDKIGIDFITIKAGRLKDLGNPSRAMTPEERAVLESVLSDTHEQFIADVAHGRGLDTAAVRKVADGRIYTGAQALAVGLVDTLGTLSDALEHCKQLCGLAPDAAVWEKKPHVPLLRQLLSETIFRGGSSVHSALPATGLYFLYDPR